MPSKTSPCRFANLHSDLFRQGVCVEHCRRLTQTRLTGVLMRRKHWFSERRQWGGSDYRAVPGICNTQSRRCHVHQGVLIMKSTWPAATCYSATQLPTGLSGPLRALEEVAVYAECSWTPFVAIFGADDGRTGPVECSLAVWHCGWMSSVVQTTKQH